MARKIPRSPVLLGFLAMVAVAATASTAEAFQIRRNVEYARPGGVALKLDAYLPFGRGPHPAVVMIHGGRWEVGSKAMCAPQAAAMAAAGIAAFSINHRPAPDFKWPAQIHDAKAAVRWVRAHAATLRVDPDRIAAWGHSSGGHLAALLACTDPSDGLEGPVAPGAPSSAVVAAVCVAAPVDFRALSQEKEPLVQFLGATHRDRPDLYREASPISYVDPTDAPCLFIHGKHDGRVPPGPPGHMAALMRAAGVDSDYLLIRTTDHLAIMLHPRMIVRSVRFLKQRLR
jgi:acetyl esterase/lipase